MSNQILPVFADYATMNFEQLTLWRKRVAMAFEKNCITLDVRRAHMDVIAPYYRILKCDREIAEIERDAKKLIDGLKEKRQRIIDSLEKNSIPEGYMRSCSQCYGSGVVPNGDYSQHCPACNGSGIAQEETEIKETMED